MPDEFCEDFFTFKDGPKDGQRDRSKVDDWSAICASNLEAKGVPMPDDPPVTSASRPSNRSSSSRLIAQCLRATRTVRRARTAAHFGCPSLGQSFCLLEVFLQTPARVQGVRLMQKNIDGDESVDMQRPACEHRLAVFIFLYFFDIPPAHLHSPECDS